MITISRKGSTRNPVVIIGRRWALKLANSDAGRQANLSEMSLYQSSSDHRREHLCPALWCSSKGLILAMAAAEPLMEDRLEIDEYLALGKHWSRERDGIDCPFEPGASNWGRFCGRLVAIDYADP